MYQPGLHILATIKDANNLTRYDSCESVINNCTEQFDLKNLGAVYHNFDGGGFTLVVCLSESHISVHTWPEHQLVNLDIYLSNFNRVNNGTVEAIFKTLHQHFGGNIAMMNKIER